MKIAIKILGNALNIPDPSSDGQFIKDFIPDTDAAGLGTLIVTPHLDEAKEFPSAAAALEFWRQQSKRCPLRDDGKPNKPLTAFHVEIASFDDKGHA